jgi:hypothetical protein
MYSKGLEFKSSREKWRKLILGMYFCGFNTEALHAVQSPVLLSLSMFFILSMKKASFQVNGS